MNERETAAGLTPTPGYRYADVAGDRLFVAGQVPRDADGTLVAPGDPAAQTAACLDNLATLLDVHGFDNDDIRHLRIHVVGARADLTTAWDRLVAWFGGETPPATLLGVTTLGYEHQVVEVEATVVRS